MSESSRISISGDNVEDFCAGLCVAADAHGVLVRIKHWSVVIQVLNLNVHIGLSTEASLAFERLGEEKKTNFMWDNIRKHFVNQRNLLQYEG